jgi:hypothetical protein
VKIIGTVIRLGNEDQAAFEDMGSDGDKFRRAVRAQALKLANETGESVEIYASDEAGGWMAAHVAPEVQS